MIADQADIFSILAAAPQEQQISVLLLAAIDDQVLDDPSCGSVQRVTTSARLVWMVEPWWSVTTASIQPT